ncbi:hypothetical protein [Xanthomonas sp. WHRI 7945]|nr:hypothetical protein [Xanthomonas campestris pv. campestris]
MKTSAISRSIVGSARYGATLGTRFGVVMGRPNAGAAIDVKHLGPRRSPIGTQYAGVAGSTGSN